MSPLPVYSKGEENKDTQEKIVNSNENESNSALFATGCDSINEMHDDNADDPLSKIVESKFNQTIRNNRMSADKISIVESSTRNGKNIIEKVTEADLEYVSSKIVENCSQTIVESVDNHSSSVISADEDGDVLVENNIIYEDELAISSSVLPDVVSNSYSAAAKVKNHDLDNDLADDPMDAFDATYQATTSESMGNLPRDFSIDVLRETAIQDNLATIAQIDNNSCGVPLSIFTEVNMNLFPFYLLAYSTHFYIQGHDFVTIIPIKRSPVH